MSKLSSKNKGKTDREWEIEEAKDKFKAKMQCQIVCGDGTGNKTAYHVNGCPMLWYERNL